MFGFLRRRPRPQWLTPLLDMQWDGAVLRFKAEAGTAQLALEIDGSHFDTVSCAADGSAHIEFAFVPNGKEGLTVLPRSGRDGAALSNMPAHLLPGQAGFAAAPTRPRTLRHVAGGARPVPFGTDVAAPAVSIVVPIFNAPDLVARCLTRVIEHTTGKARLILIDDASSDAQIAPLLARFGRIPGVCVLRNEHNRGFTATANRGIAAAGTDDVVLLNADTEVGPNWLQGLRRAALIESRVATATAVSDNAGAFSVPELEQENPGPAAWSLEASARALWQQAGLAYPQLPTGNGFCMYIRRGVIDAVGALDEVAFPQGYGEENDFCQRAAQAGLIHLIAGNVYVGHARSASFGAQRRASLGAAGMAVLRERWPDYEAEVGRSLHSFARRVLDWRVRRAFAAATRVGPPCARLLWVGADAPRWSDAQVWNLVANDTENELLVDGEVVAANTWQAHDPEPSYRALWDWLQIFAIEALLVSRHGDSVAEILCRLLDIPIFAVTAPFAASAREALTAGIASTRSFKESA